MAHLLKMPRLKLRPWTTDDLESLAEICSDPVVMRYVGSGALWSTDRCVEFVAENTRLLAEHGYCQWAVELTARQQLIGFCGFVPHGEAVEIGWRLASQCHRNGFGLEASQAAIQFARSAGITRIVATIQAENAASLRLAERLGMSKTASISRNDRQLWQFEIDLNRPVKMDGGR